MAVNLRYPFESGIKSEVNWSKVDDEVSVGLFIYRLVKNFHTILWCTGVGFEKELGLSDAGGRVFNLSDGEW